MSRPLSHSNANAVPDIVVESLTDTAPTSAPDTLNLSQSCRLTDWGAPYFSANQAGELCLNDAQNPSQPAVSVLHWVRQLKRDGLATPLYFRFLPILRDRLRLMQAAFHQAYAKHDYAASYLTIYPVKANPDKTVLQTLAEAPASHLGFEAGSKAELLAILTCCEASSRVIVCNGYKDQDYLRLALLAEKAGHMVYLVLEKASELPALLELAASLQVRPRLGLRVRLKTGSHSHWAESAGDTAKFGVPIAQIQQVVEHLKLTQQQGCLELLHFHLGSQISDLDELSQGVRECLQYYAYLHQAGITIQAIDIGGGIAVDYSGLKSSDGHSCDYDLSNCADRLLQTISDSLKQQQLPPVTLFSESGRALVAQHTALVLDVYAQESPPAPLCPDAATAAAMSVTQQPLLQQLAALSQVDLQVDWPADECYQRCHQLLEQARQEFLQGRFDLQAWAQAEQWQYHIYRHIWSALDKQQAGQQNLAVELRKKLAHKLIGNFSLFRSLADAWGIQQFFPIIAMQDLHQVANCDALLHDLTCDSDGCLRQYLAQGELSEVMPWYQRESGSGVNEAQYIGVFLLGAYQEVLGNMHNLFANPSIVTIDQNADGEFYIRQVQASASLDQILQELDFSPEQTQFGLQKLARRASTAAQMQQTHQQLLALTQRGSYCQNSLISES